MDGALPWSTRASEVEEATPAGICLCLLAVRAAGGWGGQFRFSAHTGPVLALDVKGDLLVTCGMSLFRREYTLEPAIKVPMAPHPPTTAYRAE
jgi:hypothetical protein